MKYKNINQRIHDLTKKTTEIQTYISPQFNVSNGGSYTWTHNLNLDMDRISCHVYSRNSAVSWTDHSPRNYNGSTANEAYGLLYGITPNYVTVTFENKCTNYWNNPLIIVLQYFPKIIYRDNFIHPL